MATTFERLLILGLDGATWTVLDPMRRRGLMPNLDALLARSAHGTLRSIANDPPCSKIHLAKRELNSSCFDI